MDEAPGTPAPEAADLQFDRVEPAADRPMSNAGQCAACNGALVHQYWASADKTLCSDCAAQIRMQNAAKPGFKGLMLGGLYGGAAAALGCGIYYLVSLSGWEFGLVAILVGLLVGFAVRKGSGGHGGLAFQLLAVCLTYCAITATYTPYVVDSLLKAENEEAGLAAQASATSEAPAKAHFGHYVVGFVIALAAPFLAGMENIMGLIILAIGLWEAWKINRRVATPLLGPYPIQAPAASA